MTTPISLAKIDLEGAEVSIIESWLKLPPAAQALLPHQLIVDYHTHFDYDKERPPERGIYANLARLGYVLVGTSQQPHCSLCNGSTFVRALCGLGEASQT